MPKYSGHSLTTDDEIKNTNTWYLKIPYAKDCSIVGNSHEQMKID